MKQEATEIEQPQPAAPDTQPTVQPYIPTFQVRNMKLTWHYLKMRMDASFWCR